MPQLYDDRTTAQRWSHFLLDILETGLVLTSSTAGKVHEDLAEHTESETEIRALDEIPTSQSEVSADDIAPSGAVIPGLGRLVNVAPSVLIGLQYSDLAGTYLDFGSEDPNVQAEIAALIEGRKPFPELYDYDTMDLDRSEERRVGKE